MRLRLILPAIAAAALALTACSSSEPPDPADTVTVTAEPTTTPDDLADHTRQTFQLTWAGATETERDTYCTSLALLGPEQAATEMANGGGHDYSLDWPLMTELMQDECATR
ncbi:hypothetical protein [Streptomyces luteogriseus]|uniref:hypothetical protein n=1 Tax=Streptomyces luteogriseus TaxID=68233 RepID=UPI003718247A